MKRDVVDSTVYRTFMGKEFKMSGDHKITPIITVEEAFEIYNSDRTFREYIDSGFFEFYGEFIWTKMHVRASNIKQMLSFEEDDSNNSQSAESSRKKKRFSTGNGNSEVFDWISNYAKAFEDINSRKTNNAQSTNQVFLRYMKDAKWNSTIFQEKTLLTANDYSRLSSDHKFKLPAYVAMAVGLGLSLDEFQKAIYLNGLSLDDKERTHNAYSFVLSMLQGKSIDECNAFLEHVGVETLGTHSRM
jgi:hypothetical protein